MPSAVLFEMMMPAEVHCFQVTLQAWLIVTTHGFACYEVAHNSARSKHEDLAHMLVRLLPSNIRLED